MTIYLNLAGNETFVGSQNEYDQVDYSGSVTDYVITQNDDGSITVYHPTLGTDTLYDIDGFWFSGEGAWYSLQDAIDLTSSNSNGGFRVDAWRNLIGTDGDDRLVDTAELGGLYGGLGDDTLVGRADAYSQGAYLGAPSDYTIYQNEDGSVIFQHDVYGRDRLIDIDGIWFVGEAKWYSIDDLLAADTTQNGFRIDAWNNLIGTDANDRLVDTADLSGLFGGLGDDTLVGRADAYSQGIYLGAPNDYTITQNANGTVFFDHPEYGRDTLTDIDGIWFVGESRWYAIEDLIDSDTGTNPDPNTGPDTGTQTTGTLVDGVLTGTNEVNDRLVGGAGDDTFYVGRGNDVVIGGAGNDTLRVDGDIIEWTFNLAADGTLTMTHPTWGENTLTGVEQLFSLRSGEAVSVTEAIRLTENLPEFRLDADNVINGTNGNDNIVGGPDGTNFYGGLGDDSYTGSARGFDQINYDGVRSEFTFTQNADGSITAEHPIWGVDVFTDIDGLFFNGVDGQGAEFILIEDLFG
jgi:Ca2+-binding RTX toxin-like protein